MPETDWLGILLAILIVGAIIVIVIAKVQGERVVDVLSQFWNLITGKGT